MRERETFEGGDHTLQRSKMLLELCVAWYEHIAHIESLVSSCACARIEHRIQYFIRAALRLGLGRRVHRTPTDRHRHGGCKLRTFSTPGGRPARAPSSARAKADSGVSSAGFTTMVQPAARAALACRVHTGQNNALRLTFRMEQTFVVAGLTEIWRMNCGVNLHQCSIRIIPGTKFATETHNSIKKNSFSLKGNIKHTLITTPCSTLPKSKALSQHLTSS